jgi:hypothetical protein
MLNKIEGKEKYPVEVSNGLEALEDLIAEVEINSAWERIGKNTKISAKKNLGCYELKKHRPWFYEGYSKLLDERKHAKLQWLHYPIETSGDDLNNVRYEACRHLGIYRGNI